MNITSLGLSIIETGSGLRRALTKVNLNNVSTVLNYTMAIQSRTRTFDDYSRQLSTAVQTGLFSAKLQILSLQYGADGFDATTSTAVTIKQIVRPTFAPTYKPTDSSDDHSLFLEYLTPIVIGGLLVIVLIIVTMYLTIVYRRYYNNKMMTKIHTYQGE